MYSCSRFNGIYYCPNEWSNSSSNHLCNCPHCAVEALEYVLQNQQGVSGAEQICVLSFLHSSAFDRVAADQRVKALSQSGNGPEGAHPETDSE